MLQCHNITIDTISELTDETLYAYTHSIYSLFFIKKKLIKLNKNKKLVSFLMKTNKT